MNTNDLAVELQKLEIPSHWYLIGDNGDTHDKSVLRLIDSQWSVYWSERGGKYELKTFATEDEACQELLRRMKEKKNRKNI